MTDSRCIDIYAGVMSDFVTVNGLYITPPCGIYKNHFLEAKTSRVTRLLSWASEWRHSPDMPIQSLTRSSSI